MNISGVTCGRQLAKLLAHDVRLNNQFLPVREAELVKLRPVGYIEGANVKVLVIGIKYGTHIRVILVNFIRKESGVTLTPLTKLVGATVPLVACPELFEVRTDQFRVSTCHLQAFRPDTLKLAQQFPVNGMTTLFGINPHSSLGGARRLWAFLGLGSSLLVLGILTLALILGGVRGLEALVLALLTLLTLLELGRRSSVRGC